MKPLVFLICLTGATCGVLAERINQEGRILGPAPLVTAPILFNTPEADAVVAAMQIMPVTSAWNEGVSRRPLLANSDAMIAQINAIGALRRAASRLPFQETNFEPHRRELLLPPLGEGRDGGSDLVPEKRTSC